MQKVKLLELVSKKGLRWDVECNVCNVMYVERCGMECIYLTDDVKTILGIHLSYNKKLQQGTNSWNHIVKIQNILKLWKL